MTWSCSATSPSSASPRSTALEDFLKQGGGVVIFGGDQVVADNYNRLLYADGKGLLPAVGRPERGRRRQEGGGALASTRSAIGTRWSRSIRARPTRDLAGLTQGADLAISQAAHTQGLEGRGRPGVRERRSRRRRVRRGTAGRWSWWRPRPTRAGRPGRSTRAIRRSCSRSSSGPRPAGSPSGISASASRTTSRFPSRARPRRSPSSRPRGSRSRPSSSRPAASASSTSSRPTCPGRTR